VAAGAVLPDLASACFYTYYALFLGLRDEVIWSELYHRPLWQAVTAPLHSFPVALVLVALAAWRRSRSGLAFAASFFLHAAVDLPFHHLDAHRHLWPVSDYRFLSPLSYWDSAHHARWVVPVEMAVLIGCSLLLWRRHPSRWLRCALILVDVGMLIAFATGRLFWST
jgi:hypothetical protein